MHTYIFKEDAGILLLKKVTLHLVCSCGVLLSAPPPAPALAHTGPHWSNFSSVLLPGQALHFPYRLSRLQPPQKRYQHNTPHSLVNATSFQQLLCIGSKIFLFIFQDLQQSASDRLFSYSLFNSLHFSHTNTL